MSRPTTPPNASAQPSAWRPPPNVNQSIPRERLNAVA